MKKLFRPFHETRLWAELSKIENFQFRPLDAPPIDGNAIAIATRMVKAMEEKFDVVGMSSRGVAGIDIEWEISNQIVKCSIQNKDVRHKRVPENGEWWLDE